jgi:hypothetical protein
LTASLGLGYVYCDRSLLQEAERARVNAQPPVHALRQHNGGRAVRHKLGDVGGLDPR